MLNKKSSYEGVMADLANAILNPPSEIADFISKFPAIAEAKKYMGSRFKIQGVDSPPPGTPTPDKVIGFVSTEDAKDGMLNTINIVVKNPELKKLLKNKDISTFRTLSGPELAVFLNEIASTIIHEAWHLNNQALELDEDLPDYGMKDESFVESKVPKPLVASNKLNKTLNILIKLADNLNKNKKYSETNHVLDMINKLSTDDNTASNRPGRKNAKKNR